MGERVHCQFCGEELWGPREACGTCSACQQMCDWLGNDHDGNPLRYEDEDEARDGE